jgi:hypothetical protein
MTGSAGGDAKFNFGSENELNIKMTGSTPVAGHNYPVMFIQNLNPLSSSMLGFRDNNGTYAGEVGTCNLDSSGHFLLNWPTLRGIIGMHLISDGTHTTWHAPLIHLWRNGSIYFIDQAEAGPTVNWNGKYDLANNSLILGDTNSVGSFKIQVKGEGLSYGGWHFGNNGDGFLSTNNVIGLHSNGIMYAQGGTGGFTFAGDNNRTEMLTLDAANHNQRFYVNNSLVAKIDSIGRLIVGTGGANIPADQGITAASSGTTRIGVNSGSKNLYLYNTGTVLKLDAYDYGTSTALGLAVGGNGGQVQIGGASGGVKMPDLATAGASRNVTTSSTGVLGIGRIAYGSALVNLTTGSAYTIVDSVGTVFWSYSSGVTLTIPNPAAYPGRIINIRNATAGTMTLSGYSVFYFQGATSATSLATDHSMTIMSDGAIWVMTSSNFTGAP